MEKDLITTKASLEAIINQMPVCVTIAEATTGNIIMSNQAHNNLFADHDPARTIFDNDMDVKILNPDMTPMVWEENPLTKATMSGNTSIGNEAYLKYKDGKVKPILTCAAPVKDDNGHIRAGVSIIVDITEIKDQQRKLQEKIRELTHINSELQKYAYVTSQDLRESMKMISTYLQFIERSS